MLLFCKSVLALALIASVTLGRSKKENGANVFTSDKYRLECLLKIFYMVFCVLPDTFNEGICTSQAVSCRYLKCIIINVILQFCRQ